MITVAYDGTRYKGWQVQKSTEDTIQGKLQKVLESMCGHPVEEGLMQEFMQEARWLIFILMTISQKMN